MASFPSTPNKPQHRDESVEDVRLNAEEGWDLIFQSFGSAKDLFAAFGGGEAYLRGERAAWDSGQLT
jgi:hypothetical protein